MSTETTNKKIKIDNGTTFGRTYTDKAVDELLKGVGGAKIIKGYLSGFTTYQKDKAKYDITMDSSVTYDGTPKVLAVYTDNTYSVLMGLIPLSAQFIQETREYGYWGELTTIAENVSTSGSGNDSLRAKYQHWAVLLSSEQNLIIIEPMSIAPKYNDVDRGKYLRVGSDGYNLEWGDVNLPIVEGTDGANNTITIQASQTQPFILKMKNATGYNYIYMNIMYNSTDDRYEYYGSSFISSDNLMIVISGYGLTLTESLNTLKDDYKTISLFGNHSILVPKNNSDTSILPCTDSDNGKVLSVVNGEAKWTNAGGSIGTLNVYTTESGFEYPDLTNVEKGLYIVNVITSHTDPTILASGFGYVDNSEIFGGKTLSLIISLPDSQIYSFVNGNKIVGGSPIVRPNATSDKNIMIYDQDNNSFITLDSPTSNGFLYYDLNHLDINNGYSWKEITPSKTISLFGNHSILVPKDSADTNIDMYLHSITIGKPNDTYINGFTFLLPSSSNLVADSIQDLETILGTTPRMIPVSGCYNSGMLIIITRLNWKGSFANSTIITTGGEEEDILPTFTSIDDKVTTL